MKWKVPSLRNNEVETDTVLAEPELSTNVQRVLAVLQGFYERLGRYTLVRVNQNGYLAVAPIDSEAQYISEGYKTVGTTPTAFITANYLRVNLWIRNTGYQDLALYHQDSTVYGNAIILPVGCELNFPNYTAAMRVATLQSGNGQITYAQTLRKVS